MCRSCYDKWLKEVNPQYKKAQLDNRAKWAAKNPDRIRIHLETRKLKEKLDPNFKLKRREFMLKAKYGITLKDFDDMLLKQKGGCKLCFRKQGDRKFHVDHDHKTGQVRGILCHQCNWYLGVVEADINILNRIKKYLNILDTRYIEDASKNQKTKRVRNSSKVRSSRRQRS